MDYKQEIEVLRRQNGELIRSRMEALQERDQLQARVAELEDAFGIALTNRRTDHATAELKRTLNRTLHQSLAAHDVQVLREYAEKFFGNSHITSDIKAKRKMLEEADRIEAEGKV